MTAATTPAGWSRPVALVVAAAFFIEQIDGTILTTAMPAIAADFDVRPADVGITMTAYLLAVAVFIPVSGWLADRLGPRRVFIAAIVLFTIASLACGLSGSLGMLTAARVVQGIAGSMMVPIGRLIVLRTTSKSELMRAVAYLTWPALTAPVIAPFIGGVITQFAGWQWVFFVNLPFGAVLIVLAWKIIPAGESSPRRRFDPVGLIFAAGAIVTLVIALELIVDPSTVALALLLLALAVIAAVLAVRWSRRSSAPLLELGAYQYVSYRISNSSGVVYRVAVSSAPFLLPLLLQDGFDWSPVQAGLMLMWVFAGNIIIKPFTTPLLRWFGFAPTIVGAAIGLTVTFVACMFMTEQTPIAVISIVFLLSGVFRSVGFTGYGTLQFAEVPASEMNGANTLSSTLTQLATGLGVAVAAVSIRLIDLGADAVGAAEGGLAGYRGTLLLMALLTVVSLIGALRLPRGVGDEVRRRAARP